MMIIIWNLLRLVPQVIASHQEVYVVVCLYLTSHGDQGFLLGNFLSCAGKSMKIILFFVQCILTLSYAFISLIDNVSDNFS